MKSIQTAIINLLLISWISYIFGQQPKDQVVQLTTSISESPPAISFNWNTIPGSNKILIYKKSKDASTFLYVASLPSDTNGYTDNDVEPGVEYEYQIRKNEATPIITYVSSGIKCQEVEYRGKVILLVDSLFVDDLQDELKQLETDLIGDGWEILRKDISRNTNVKYVKSVIRSFYQSDSINVKAVLLYGHIPVPYSGCYQVDIHPDHFGAYGTDVYYSTIDESIWTDNSANCTSAARTENWNVPGDGKFDLFTLPRTATITLQVGRVDLYNLPAYPQSETELLRNYLKKNHDFRHKKINPKLKALIYNGGGTDFQETSGWRIFTGLFNYPNVQGSTFFPQTRLDSYMWSMVIGGCEYTWCVGLQAEQYVSQVAKTIFTSIGGSYVFDWDSQNNLMRAALASNSWTLNCMTGDFPYYPFHKMGMGETVGYCVRAAANYLNSYYYPPSLHIKDILMDLLGDPTLRMHIVAPVNSLQSAVTADSTVLLSWKPADDNIIGYQVYKFDTLTNKYNKITTSPVTETWFEDTMPYSSNNYYMVRTFKLTQSASGSYYNLSQGIFDTVHFIPTTPVPVAGIELSVNPESLLPLKMYDPFSIDVNITPVNATNKLIKWSIENITGIGKFDVNGEILAEKGGNIAIVAEALDGSGVIERLEVTIDSVPDTPGTITGPTSMCRDNSKQTYAVPEIRGATFYIWTLPNGISDTTLANEIIYFIDDNASSGDIIVKGHNPFASGSESSLAIIVNEIPPKPVITFDGSVLHSNAPLGNQWYKDSELIEGATDSIYVPAEEGIYYVEVTLNNCTSRPSNWKSVQLTAINLINFTNGILIYPNPTENIINIEIDNNDQQSIEIEILTVTGKVIYLKNYRNAGAHLIEQLDLSGFSKGIYIVKVMHDRAINVGKVVVR